MAVSQFKFYTSYDIGAPILNGNTGSLLPVLDAVLVSGYGSGSNFKSGSGWTKPFGNTGSLGCWKQPSGSRCIMFINDAAIMQAGTKEAWLFGYEHLHNMSGSFGTGSGQFPHPGQQNLNTGIVSGSLQIRKTVTFNNVERPWLIFADDRTMYMFVLSGDSAGVYHAWWFGDIYSFAGTSDTTKCVISANARPNNGTGGTTNGQWADEIVTMANTSYEGMFIQSTYSGRGCSKFAGKICNMSNGTLSTQIALGAAGAMVKTDPYNNSYHVSPVLIIESTLNQQIIRGQLRGMYGLIHGTTGFDDGQIIIGSGVYAGRVFRFLKGGMNGGAWLMEISNTVEYN
jgi:hypothetical protein